MLQSVSVEPLAPTRFPLPNEIKALLLDDSNFDRARIRRLTNKTELPITMDEVDSIENLDRAVAKQNYDVILIDYRLPNGDGMMALDLILDSAMNKSAAKIMITGNGAVDTAVRAMRSGCDDFLTKDNMSVDLLRESMVHAMRTARQKQQLQLMAERHQTVIRDALVDALRDKEVLGGVENIVQHRLQSALPEAARMISLLEAEELDAIFAQLNDEDEFIFH